MTVGWGCSLESPDTLQRRDAASRDLSRVAAGEHPLDLVQEPRPSLGKVALHDDLQDRAELRRDGARGGRGEQREYRGLERFAIAHRQGAVLGAGERRRVVV